MEMLVDCAWLAAALHLDSIAPASAGDVAIEDTTDEGILYCSSSRAGLAAKETVASSTILLIHVEWADGILAPFPATKFKIMPRINH